MSLTARWGHWLLRLRVFVLDREYIADPYSSEYLYLIQQQKRLSLSRSVGRLRPRNLLLFPIIIVIVLFKCFDLFVTNQIVQSLINERLLLDPAGRAGRDDGQ
jgi:hypothetical protein